MLKLNYTQQDREELSRKISWGHWFAFFNIIISFIIGSRYAFFSDWPDTLLGKIYFFISIIGHFSFIVFAIYLLIIFPLSFIIKNHRTFRGITVIIATLCTTVLLVDSEIYKRFYIHLSSMVWDLVINPENGELARDWQIFFAPMPIILLLQMLFSRWSWQKFRSLERQKWIKPVSYTFLLAFIAMHLIYAWADATFYRPITAQRSNLPLSYPMTARKFLEKNGLLDAESYQAILTATGRADARYLDYPKRNIRYATPDTTPNILLINISGLRNNVISETATPALYQFAQQSLNFKQNYSSSNQAQEGLVGLFYGLPGNYLDSILFSKTQPVLLKRLRELDYQIQAQLTQQDAQPLFSVLFEKTEKQYNKTNVATFKQWENWYQQQNKDNSQPWFSFIDVSLVTTKSGQNKTADSAENAAIYQYSQNLLQVDQSFAELIETLKQHQQFANTLIIVTADTGFSENDDIADFSPDKIHVPLLVHWGDKPAQQLTNLTSNLDIVPTLLKQIFKAENPATDFSLGNNLFADNATPDNWTLSANNRWIVIIDNDGVQYQIDKYGNYKKFNAEYQQQNSTRPPLGLFLAAFSEVRSFIEH
ncbi:membrane protein [Gallibacterium salpingitidis]|uniref:Membrane protein n=1 Tax=Gallibacterium salpingitidis TaxID=505341 RepID=A0A1A7Q0Y8_9PAST|nr:DUF3413 domain-containing protein [Gallibacterium salpingitidis]OBW94595.1 membrane protein [Gallibacterium salpingitidis]OBX06862.1 membrane protein [Gallibacterium salpingitidis]OBX07602.1 membrane protein [Gallibacterium salpingitidis]WKT00174.1 DUF3413 domain-containing protein [Gallibacterium salpingitidis]